MEGLLPSHDSISEEKQGASWNSRSQHKVGLASTCRMFRWPRSPARILLGCTKPLITYKGLVADLPQLCALFQTLYFHTQVHVIVAHLAKYKWASCVSCVTPITGESRDRGCSLKAGLGPEGRNQGLQAEAAFRESPMPDRNGCEKTHSLLGAYFYYDKLTLQWPPTFHQKQGLGDYFEALKYLGNFFFFSES